MTPLLAGLAASILSAQVPPSKPVPVTATPGSHLRGIARCKASQLIGCNVTNTKNESLGEIQDIVLDDGNRRIAYAVLASGGFLGMGETYFAMPWRLIEVSQRGTDDKPTATLGLDKKALKDAPGFDKGKWPDMADKNWAKQVDDYYRSRNETSLPGDATKPEGSGDGGERGVDRAPASKAFVYRRLSKLIGMDVVDGQHKDLADVEDLVVDTSGATIDAALLSFGGTLGIGEQLVLVPSECLTIDRGKNVLVFQCTKKRLAAMALPDGELPALNNDAWLLESRALCAKAAAALISSDGDVVVVNASGVVPVPYTDSYDIDEIETVKGTITTIGCVRIGDRREERVRLRVRAANGHEVIVYAAPASFADQQALRLRPGKTIEVTGSPAKNGDQTVLVAGSIIVDGKTAELRDDDGHVTWRKD
jgi:sporulation protein YlmC with PRC-barrel domain